MDIKCPGTLYQIDGDVWIDALADLILKSFNMILIFFLHFR